MNPPNGLTGKWIGPFDLRDFMDTAAKPYLEADMQAINQGGVYAWYDRTAQQFAYFGRSFSSIRTRQLQHLANQAGLVQSHRYGPTHEQHWGIDWRDTKVQATYNDVGLFMDQVKHAFAYLDAIDVWVFPMPDDRGQIQDAERLLLKEIPQYGTGTMGAVKGDLSNVRDALLSIRTRAPTEQRQWQP